jgi:hypothetical protein
MATYLKAVGWLVMVLGIVAGLMFVAGVVGDEPYYRAKMALDRNPGNVFFETEFRVALARHVFIVSYAVSAFLTALIGGSLLLGLGALHRKLDRWERGETAK